MEETQRAEESAGKSLLAASLAATRSAIGESLRSRAGSKIDNVVLRNQITIPRYLRKATVEALRNKSPVATASKAYDESRDLGRREREPPDLLIVVFVNLKSGGHRGRDLMRRLRDFVVDEQVFDISQVNPQYFAHISLTCLEKMDKLGDNCAKRVRQKLRIVIAGGNGAVGWVLGSFDDDLFDVGSLVPPLAIIPLGTENDISRSFGWGDSLPSAWRSAVKQYLIRAITDPIRRLDSWYVLMPAGEDVELPRSLKNIGDFASSEDANTEELVPETVSCSGGVFFNYFSIVAEIIKRQL